MLNIALCCPRLILPYSHRWTHSILPYAAVHARYCLVLSMLNIALQTRCHTEYCLSCQCSILPYAGHAQCNIHAEYWACAVYRLNIALRVSTLNIAVQPRCPCSILPWAVTIRVDALQLTGNIASTAQYCHMLSTLAIALCCPHSLLPYAVNAHALCCPCLILPYRHAVHAQDSPVYA